MRALLIALVLHLGCDYWDRVADADGTVYDCGDGVEYCYLADHAAELSAATGRTCSAGSIFDRFWSGLTNGIGRGCRYTCPDEVGCNAEIGGCYCPSSPPRAQPASSWSGEVWVDLQGVREQITHDVCDSEVLMPAIYCGDLRWLKHDGCRWRCVSILERGAQQ